MSTSSQEQYVEDPLTGVPFQDEHSDDDGTEAWQQRLIGLQRASLILAHFMALLSMIVVIIWINLLGGLSWEKGQSKLVFNWHPLLMITAFSFMTVASLSFRYRGLGSRKLAKTLHGTAWAVALLCAIVALIAVFRSHNDALSGYIANLYSLHSWIGIFVGISYSFQFLAGLVTFGFPAGSLGITPSFKAKVLLVHYYFGPIIYLAFMLTILLGIQEKEGFVGCSYTITKADVIPFQNFLNIPESCRISHLLGFLVLFTGLCTNFALYQIGRGGYRQT
jgi:cytochrome b-561